MSRTIGFLLVLALAFGFALASAPDGFDVTSGTGKVGVGEFMPPGQGDAPDSVTALGVKTTTHTWTCTHISDPSKDWQGVGVTTQGVRAVGDANLNIRGSIVNYTFGGWATYGVPTYESDHNPYAWRGITNINCRLYWTHTNTDTLVDYSFGSFSY